jgi:hypothetical protein
MTWQWSVVVSTVDPSLLRENTFACSNIEICNLHSSQIHSSGTVSLVIPMQLPWYQPWQRSQSTIKVSRCPRLQKHRFTSSFGLLSIQSVMSGSLNGFSLFTRRVPATADVIFPKASIAVARYVASTTCVLDIALARRRSLPNYDG